MSNINNKLDYLDETKQLIKQAIIDKGQEVSDEDTFRSYVDKISDIETGNDTKDATATSNDILYPETAYISNGKVTGNIMPTYSSNTTLSQTNTISRSLSYSLLDINYDAKIAIVSDEDYKFNFCNIVNNEIDYENSAYITLNDFEEGMDGTYTLSKCCTNFDKNTNDLYLYLLFTFQNTFKVFCYTYNIKTKSSKYIDTYELTIDDANNSLVLNMMIRPNYPNQVIVFCGYTSTTALGSYLTTVFLQFNTVALELQKIQDTISTSANQYAAKVESCYFTSNGEYLCINVRTGTLSDTTQNGVIYHCVNNFLESIVDSTQYVTLFENGNYMAYNQPTRNHCLFNVNGDVLYSYSGNLGEVSTEQLTYTNKCILGNYLFGFAHPEDFIDPIEPLILYCCKLNEDYTITKEYEINVGSRTLFNCYNAILYDNKTTRNFDGYLGDTEKEIISLERNNTVYFSTKDSDVTKNDVLQGKIFYNSEGKQIGNKIFTDYNDSVGILETNSAISATAVGQLIGVEMLILPDIEYLDKVKVNDIVKVVVTIIDVATSSTTLKCNCLAQILEIIDHSDKQFRANIRILAADVNTEDGTATSEDIVEGKTAYVNNERVHGTAKLGTDTSDADATPNDILSPKTAYVNGQKIIGNIQTSYKTTNPQLDTITLDQISSTFNSNYRCFTILPNKNILIIEKNFNSGDVECKIFNQSAEQLSYYKFAFAGGDYPIKVTCGNTKDSNGYYNIAILSISSTSITNNQTITAHILKVHSETNNFIDKVFKLQRNRMYGYPAGYCVTFANLDPNKFVFYADNRNPNGWIEIYNIDDNINVTLYSSIQNTNAYWVADILFNEDDTLLYTTCSHGQDGGSAIIFLLNSYIIGKIIYSESWQSIIILKNNLLLVGTQNNSNRTLYSMTIDRVAETLTLEELKTINNILALPGEYSGIGRMTGTILIDNGTYFGFTWSDRGGANNQYIIYNFDFEELTASMVYQSSQTFAYNPYPFTNRVNMFSYKADSNLIYYYLSGNQIIDSVIINRTKLINTQDAKTVSSSILYNQLVYTSSGATIGTMPNNGELNYISADAEQIIPAGYTSGGTIAAYDITQNEDYNKCLIICNNILTGGNITFLNYIESTGTQFINTGISGKNVAYLEFKFIPTSLLDNYQTYIGSAIDDFTLGSYASLSKIYLRYKTKEVFTSEGISIDNINIFSIYNNQVNINSNTKTYSTSEGISESDTLIYIFNNSSSEDSRPSGMRFYSLKLYDVNNNLLAYLVPVLNNNVPCLYDYITKNYLYNQGSGEFLYG